MLFKYTLEQVRKVWNYVNLLNVLDLWIYQRKVYEIRYIHYAGEDLHYSCYTNRFFLVTP